MPPGNVTASNNIISPAERACAVAKVKVQIGELIVVAIVAAKEITTPALSVRKGVTSYICPSK